MDGRIPARLDVEASHGIRAFGLDLDAEFPIVGARRARQLGAAGHRVRVELAASQEIRDCWQPTAPQRLCARRRANGRVAFSIDADTEAGYLIRAEPFGHFWISPDAALIRCSPAQATAWRWQRCLIGQVLPFAAVLRGLEVFHASAVAGADGAWAFIGESTAGKTSLAVSMLLRGAPFLTDDVLALSIEGDDVIAHPGVAVASLRHSAARLLSPAEGNRLGQTLGQDRNARRVALVSHGEAMPLRAVCLLERRTTGRELVIERLDEVNPLWLLAATFNFVITSPQRLTNQLDVCARLASTSTVYRLSIPPAMTPAQVADRLCSHTFAEAA